MQRGLSLRRRITRSGCDTSGAAGPASFAFYCRRSLLNRVEDEGCYLSASSGVADLSIIVVLPSAAKYVARNSCCGEYGQFGYKLDARPANRAVALRHKKRNATGSHEHQQLLWHDFRQHNCRNCPPPRFRIRRTRQKRCRRDRGRNRSNGRIKRVDNAGSRSAAPTRSARRRAWACSRACLAATRARF